MADDKIAKRPRAPTVPPSATVRGVPAGTQCGTGCGKAAEHWLGKPLCREHWLQSVGRTEVTEPSIGTTRLGPRRLWAGKDAPWE